MTANRAIANRGILDYALLCLVMMDVAGGSRDSQTSVPRIRQDLVRMNNPQWEESIKHFYKIDWGVERFYSPLEKIERGESKEALEELTKMHSEIKGKLKRYARP